MRPVRKVSATLILLLCGSCVTATPVAILPADLPNATQQRTYSFQFQLADGGSATWAIIAGDVPAGLTLATDTGRLSGTPREAGDFEFTVRARRRSGIADSLTVSLTVVERLTAATSLEFGRVGEAYDDSIAVDGGVPPYSLTLVGLPAGLSFDRDTRRITGTPVLAEDDILLELTVRDNGSPRQTLTQTLMLTIKPLSVQITTESLPDATAGVHYSQAVVAADGREPYAFAVVSGVLPDGLRLNTSTGVISGTPTTPQTSTFRVRVTDDDAPASTATREFSIEVQ